MMEALLREHVPDVDVWAYGGRVNGRSHDGSDLHLGHCQVKGEAFEQFSTNGGVSPLRSSGQSPPVQRQPTFLLGSFDCR